MKTNDQVDLVYTQAQGRHETGQRSDLELSNGSFFFLMPHPLLGYQR